MQVITDSVFTDNYLVGGWLPKSSNKYSRLLLVVLSCSFPASDNFCSKSGEYWRSSFISNMSMSSLEKFPSKVTSYKQTT